jgi:Alternative oxidase
LFIFALLVIFARPNRLDTEELKELLRKHNAAFTDEEIVEFGELYYAGRAGGSIPIQEFLEKLDEVAKNKVVHPILEGNCSAEYIYRKPQHNYTPEELDIALTHKLPVKMVDKMAFYAVKGVRFLFDKATGWNGVIAQENVMNRVIFLETIAAVPGMVAAIVRHFRSLRSMERDGGLMHVFLEEANNERMHLLSFIKMKDPSKLFRAAVVGSQFGFGTAFLLAYITSPRFCHSFVGYVEEEACATYTKIVKTIEAAPEGSELAVWRTELAPSIARGYWKLGAEGTVLDMMYAVRADEAEHRDVNHACSELKNVKVNPFNDPELKINIMLRKYVNDIMSRN